MKCQDVSVTGCVRLLILSFGLLMQSPVAAEEAPSMELLEFLADLEEVEDQGLVHPMDLVDQPGVVDEDAVRRPEHQW